MALEVQPSGSLVVRSPLRLPLHEIEAFLRSRHVWIADRLSEASQARSAIPPLPTEKHFHHRGIVKEWQEAKADLAKWRRNEAKELFLDIIDHVLPDLGVGSLRFQSLRLRKMRRRWGSCSADGNITLNEHLIMVPDRCTRAVVVHELAHLVHMDHSKAFHRMARGLMTGYEAANTELDAWTAVLAEMAPPTKNGAQGPVERRPLWFS